MAIGEMFPTGKGLSKRKFFDELRSKLWTNRSSFDSHWRELGEYFQPRRPRFLITDRNRGDKRSQQLVDSTPRFSARTLQSGLHAGLTSPARPWMKLTTPDATLAEQPAVKVWLHAVTLRMLAVFTKTNLYNALPVLYGDLGTFGTAAMGVLEDEKDVFRCYSYPIGSWAVSMDNRGLPSIFVREYEMTVEQAVQEFGFPRGHDASTGPDWSRFSLSLKNAWDEGRRTDAVQVCWMVTANPPKDRKGLTPWPYLSVHFEKAVQGSDFQPAAPGNRNELLREGGFFEFPVLIPRWDVTGEDDYGTDCPGMTALGDAKQLQTMQKRKAQAVEKMVNPPLVAPPHLKTQKTSLLPGDITFVDEREGSKGLRPIHETRLSVQELSRDIAETQFRIQRSFYEDLFLMLASTRPGGSPAVTAREIDERHEEKLLALGPVLERTNDELLDPLIDRTYAIMDRLGLIPPAPPQLEGVDLRVEYVSLMSQAQKLVGVNAQDRFFASVTALAQLDPSVLNKVDMQQAVDDYAEQIGVDPSLVRTDDEANEITQGQQRAAQAAAEAEQAAQLAQTAKSASETDLEKDTLLRRAMGGVQP